MNNKLTQEKFQRTEKIPADNQHSNSWTSQESQRVAHRTPEMMVRSSRPGAPNQADFMSPDSNALPPGMFNDNQWPDLRPQGKYVASGSTDPSNNINGETLKRGYAAQDFTPAQADNDIPALFHDEATVDGQTGYLIRNNYLDRG